MNSMKQLRMRLPEREEEGDDESTQFPLSMIQGEISTGRTGVLILSRLISPVFVTISQSRQAASPLSRLVPRHSQVEKRAGALHSFFPLRRLPWMSENRRDRGDIGTRKRWEGASAKTRLDTGARSKVPGIVTAAATATGCSSSSVTLFFSCCGRLSRAWPS